MMNKFAATSWALMATLITCTSLLTDAAGPGCTLVITNTALFQHHNISAGTTIQIAENDTIWDTILATKLQSLTEFCSALMGPPGGNDQAGAGPGPGSGPGSMPDSNGTISAGGGQQTTAGPNGTNQTTNPNQSAGPTNLSAGPPNQSAGPPDQSAGPPSMPLLGLWNNCSDISPNADYSDELANDTNGESGDVTVTFKGMSDACMFMLSNYKYPEQPTSWQYELHKKIHRYYLRVLVGIGVPGNVLALIIIATMKPLTSSSIFVAILAVTDTCVLGLKLAYNEHNLLEAYMNDGGCQSIVFFISTLAMFSVWIVVLMTLERFVAVVFPFRIKQIFSKRNVYLFLVVCCVLLAGLNLHYFFIYGATEWEGFHYCSEQPGYDHWHNKIWTWVDAAFNSIIPCVILFVLNGLIIHGLRKSHKLRRKVSVSPEDPSITQRPITIMLLGVSISLVLLTLPVVLSDIITPYWDYKSDDYEMGKFLLLDTIVTMLFDINFAVNFYLYFLTCGKFRKRLVALLRCRQIARKFKSSGSFSSGAMWSQKTTSSDVKFDSHVSENAEKAV